MPTKRYTFSNHRTAIHDPTFAESITCRLNMTAIKIDVQGHWHRVSKGAPEQILSLANTREDVKNKVHNVIDKFSKCGSRKPHNPAFAMAQEEFEELSSTTNWNRHVDYASCGVSLSKSAHSQVDFTSKEVNERKMVYLKVDNEGNLNEKLSSHGPKGEGAASRDGTEISISSFNNPEDSSLAEIAEDSSLAEIVNKPLPYGSPISHISFEDSLAASSSQMSLHVRTAKAEDNIPARKKSQLALKNSPTHLRNYSDAQSSGEHLRKGKKNSKRPNSSGSDKSNHVDHEERNHICGLVGDGVNDAPALQKADIGIVVADATNVARSVSDIVLTELGLSFIISDVLTNRAIFQRMKNYTVLRDGRWSEEDASILVPKDIISIKLGDIVPADAWLLEGDPLRIDQSALTGESLPVTKHPNNEVFSSSTCKQGEIEAVDIATGIHTFLGKAVHLVDSTNQVGHFQQVLTAIGKFCICSIAIGMLLEIVVMYPIQNHKYRDGIDNLLVLLTGDIPIAMPTVLLVTMAIGAHRLSQQDAITKRITAIEEMAGMDVLCSDKMGTLTLNKLSIDKNLVEIFAKGVKKEDEDFERSSQCGLWLLIFTYQV